MKISKIVYLILSFILMPFLEAKALDLNLSTNPAFDTIGGKRYVIISKGDTVTFTATTDESVYYLSWVFENGTPGSGSTDDPAPVTYNESAEGKENAVKFTTKRYDENDNHCVTENGKACTVIVGAIKRAIAPAGGGSETFDLITDTNKKVLPGQKIILKCELPTVTVQEYEWTLPGTTFKDYVANQSTGTLTPLAAGDKNQQIVRFYWADTGDAREVKCRVKVNNKWYDIKNKVDVKKPTSTLTATIGEVKLNGAGDRCGLYPKAGQTDGLSFTGKVEVPTGFAEGSWNWVQLVNDGLQRKLANGTVERGNNFGTYVLDNTYPYEPPPYSAHPGTAGGYATGEEKTNSDTPSSGLDPNTLQSKETHDNFQTFLMFLPPGEESRYVPVRKFTWWWKYKATTTAGVWSVVAGSTGEDKTDSVETTSHPTWTANWDPFSWVAVP